MMADDDEWALDVYEMMEAKKRSKLAMEEECRERWWIVLHTRVAVRPLPTTDGKPLAVLPCGSVLRSKKVVFVGSQRWLCVANEELDFFVKKGQAPPSEAYMLVEAKAPQGALLMVAPKEYNWEKLKALAPKHRGEAARQEMLVAKPVPSIFEANDDDIDKLLNGDPMVSAAPVAGEQVGATVDGNGGQRAPIPPPRQPTAQIHLREFVDGLVEVEVSQSGLPTAPVTRRSYDDISMDLAVRQRKLNADAKAEQERREAEEREEQRKKMAARQRHFNPKDWPEQAKLAEMARTGGEDVERQLLEEYWYMGPGGSDTSANALHTPMGPIVGL